MSWPLESTLLPQPGDIVAGKYRIQRVIGSGGMSVVFGATHNLTHKRVAIKWLVAEPGVSSEDSAKRFMREARLAGHFQHPNVVQIYDFGENDGSFYMVMEWLEGESLAARLERDKRLSFAKVCEYMIPCMRAMQRAHGAGIIHRDLKPANIFLCSGSQDKPEHAKVLDFGISKLLTPKAHLGSLVTKSGMVIGTPHYLSPEQLRARAIDARTDIYGFGVILYQTLSGQLPFPADNFGDLAVQIATGAPKPLRELVPNVPDGVEELVSRAMAREPIDRFQDMAEIIAALEELARRASLPPELRKQLELSQRPQASTTPVHSQPPPLPKRTTPNVAGKWPFLLLGIATLVTAAALLLSYLYFDRETDVADLPQVVPAAPAAPGEAPTLANDVAAATQPETPPETQPTPKAKAAPEGLVPSAPSTTATSAAAIPAAPQRAAPEPHAVTPPTPRPKPQPQRPPEMNPPSAPKPSAASTAEPAAPDHNPLHMTIQ